jgi:glycosyltransferase involved in cell wall biosynthesis
MGYEHSSGCSEVGPNAVPHSIDLSVVTTARDEAGNVREFLSRTHVAFKALGVNGEVIFIDDGSADGTADIALAFAAEQPTLAFHLIRHGMRRGIAAGIVEGSTAARGTLVCFLPCDLESLPDEDIPKLYHSLDANTDIAVGWRHNRADGKENTSKLFNLVNRTLFNIEVHDANWIKLVRRDKLTDLVLLPDWQGFLLGVLAARGCRIKEVPTEWHRRRYGRTKFNWQRMPRAVAACASVWAYCMFREQPLLLFILASLFSGGMAVLFAVAASVSDTLTFAFWALAVVFLVQAITWIGIGAAAEVVRWGLARFNTGRLE